MGDIIKSYDTVRDSLSLDEFNPADFGSAVTMGSTAGFSIDTLNIDNSERVAWDNTSLIKMETVVLLSLGFIHETFVDFAAAIDNSVCCIFDFLFLLFAQTLVVGDIQMSHLGSLLGSMLPDVWSKNLSARGENYMGSCMVSHQLLSSLLVDRHMNTLSFV